MMDAGRHVFLNPTAKQLEEREMMKDFSSCYQLVSSLRLQISELRAQIADLEQQRLSRTQQADSCTPAFVEELIGQFEEREAEHLATIRRLEDQLRAASSNGGAASSWGLQPTGGVDQKEIDEVRFELAGITAAHERLSAHCCKLEEQLDEARAKGKEIQEQRNSLFTFFQTNESVLRETFPDQFGKHSTVQSFLAQAGSCVLSMTKSAVTHVTGMGGGNSKPSSSVDGSIQGQDNDAEAEARLKGISRELDQLQQQREQMQQQRERREQQKKAEEAPPPRPAAVTEPPIKDALGRVSMTALFSGAKEQQAHAKRNKDAENGAVDDAVANAKKAEAEAALAAEAASWERATEQPKEGTLVRVMNNGHPVVGTLACCMKNGKPTGFFDIMDGNGSFICRVNGWGKSEDHSNPMYVKKASK
jgi:hypothetical protein